MIKKKFLIWFENYENAMSTQISISESVFKEQLRFLREQVKLTKDDDVPVKEVQCSVLETESTVTTTYYFSSGLADTYIRKIEAKEGYRLLSAKEKKARDSK